MPWTTSNRKTELPREWATLRKRVLARDGGVCQARDSQDRLCGAPANQVDHISRGHDHTLTNLQALCCWHHARKSSTEGHAARAPRPRQARAAERHPGIVSV